MSFAAVDHGKVVDTTMGFTPLEGLVMGTRSGDIDPAIVTFIEKTEKLSADELDNVLNKKSGVLGISGISSDFRDIEAEAEKGNKRAQLALDVFIHRVRHYLGAYIVEMGGVDCIVFTAGVGENDKATRINVCKGLEELGIELCEKRNDIRGEERVISTDESKVKILLIPTNEELMIARDTFNIVTGKGVK